MCEDIASVESSSGSSHREGEVGPLNTSLTLARTHPTPSGFKRLRNTLSKTSVGVLELHLGMAMGRLANYVSVVVGNKGGNRNQHNQHSTNFVIACCMPHAQFGAFIVLTERNMYRSSSAHQPATIPIRLFLFS